MSPKIAKLRQQRETFQAFRKKIAKKKVPIVYPCGHKKMGSVCSMTSLIMTSRKKTFVELLERPGECRDDGHFCLWFPERNKALPELLK